MTYSVRLIEEEEGGYSVIVPGLPGCASQGESREEALDNIKGAIQDYLAAIRESVTEGEIAEVTVEVKVA